jgi:uncharacterized protein (DUF4415 family)
LRLPKASRSPPNSVRILADSNIVARAVHAMRAVGHDVVYVAERPADPGDTTMTDEEDKAITEAALTDPDARPLHEERLARMSPASAADAADIKRRLRGRPRVRSLKHLVSLRLDPDVVARFRATGPGWQSRINEVLREHLPEVSK